MYVCISSDIEEHADMYILGFLNQKSLINIVLVKYLNDYKIKCGWVTLVTMLETEGKINRGNNWINIAN